MWVERGGGRVRKREGEKGKWKRERKDSARKRTVQRLGESKREGKGEKIKMKILNENDRTWCRDGQISEKS